MKTLKLFMFALVLPWICRGAGLSVKADPQWKPATAAQRHGVEGQPGYTVLDFSVYDAGGSGLVLRAPAGRRVTRPYMESSVTGFIQSVVKGGGALVTRHPASIGSLQGVCLTMKGQAKGQAIGIVSYLIYSTDSMFAVTIYGPPDMTDTNPLVASYLSRVIIDSTLTPANLSPDAPDLKAMRLGMTIGFWFFGLAAFAVLVICIVVFVKRRREMGKPPPLPL